MPAALAMAAAVQCVVSPGGSALVRATTRSITGWASGGMRGGRVLSHSRPSTPACMKRSCQRQTTDLLLPVRRMIVAVPRPSAVSSTIRQRQTCFCGLLRSATTASRRARSAAFTVTMIPLRIPETRTPASPWESSKGLNCQVGSTSAEDYRVSVKREPHGAAGAYIDDKLQVGDVVDASATRGSFSLRPGDAPIVFLSAGIGATPMLAMLHTLAAAASTREVWWLYGARNRREHPFAEETCTLLKALARGHSHICYSSPDPEDTPGLDFDARGRLDMRVLRELDVPRYAEFYVCGPPVFMSGLTAGITDWGVAARRIPIEIFGSGPAKPPCGWASQLRPPH